MNEIFVKFESNNCLFRTNCAICGTDFREDMVVAYMEVKGDIEESIGSICANCLKAGPIEAAKHAIKHADELRKRADKIRGYADLLCKLAPDLRLTPEDHWKTSDELKTEISKMIADAWGPDVPF
jgi:hypothetical protein